MVMKRVANFDAGEKALAKLGTIITYAALANFFFVGLEFFVAYYSRIPGHMHTLDYLFWGLEGHDNLVLPMRFSMCIGLIATFMLLFPQIKRRESTFALCCGMLFLSLWIDKGIGMVLGGFVPNPFDRVTEYYPTFVEIGISMAVWAAGALILTILYKIVVTVQAEVEG